MVIVSGYVLVVEESRGVGADISFPSGAPEIYSVAIFYNGL
jgi:hypothetical protein